MSDANEQLAEHERRPSVWEPPQDRLLPDRVRDLIDAAVAAVSPPDRLEHYAGLVDRLLPPIELFPDILGDAWETIAGDPDATRRFTERLRWLQQGQQEALHSPDEGTEGWHPDDLRALQERLARRRGRVPNETAVVSEEGAALLIMAAVHAGQGDQASIHHNLQVALAQLDGYDRLRLLFAEGQPALRDDRRRTRVLRDLLDHIDEELHGVPGPPSGVPWPLRPPVPDLPEGQAEMDRWLVAAETLLAWQGVWEHPVFRGEDLFYAIQLSHSAACPGQLVFITSKGFGTTPGKVRFHVPPGKGQNDILAIGPSSYVDVDPQSWTDTQIAVVIPQFASCGKFVIRIPTGTVTVNGKAVATYHSVGPIKIGGTLPEVLDLRADGVAGQLVTTRGALVKITWLVCPDDATVTLNVKEDGTSLWTKTGLAASGSETLPVGGLGTTTYTVSLTAKTVCGTASKTMLVIVHQKAEIYLQGLEIAQATQFFWGGTTLPKSVNQVPLVAGKPTLVRAYLGTTQDPSFNNGEVKGAHVELRGWFEGGGELPGSPLQPLNSGPFTGRNWGIASDRGDLARTANFLIPQSWMVPGPSLRLQARVTLSSGRLDTVDPKNATATLTGVRFYPARPLDVVVVLVDYTGTCSSKYPNCNGAPSMADAVKTLHSVRRVFPTDKLRIWLPEAGDRILKYAGDKGCGACGGFSCLIGDLSDIAKGYDNDDDMIWWAAVKVGVHGAGGCGSSTHPGAHGFAASRVTDDTTAWEEFGHAYGRDHTFEDGNYPKHGYANSDSIGEFGIDVEKLSPWDPKDAGNHLYSPYTAADFMSYDPAPLWVSPYTYMGLMQAFFAKKATGSGVTTSVPGASYVRHREERLVICGVLWPETGEVVLRPLYHAPLYPKDSRGKPTRYELALVDAKGRTLVADKVRCHDDRPLGQDDRPLPARLQISQMLPLEPGAAALEVRDGGRVLLRVERPESRPTVEDVVLEQGDDGWRLRWHSAHADEVTLLHGVAVTYDDGSRWQRLRMGFIRPTFQVDPAALAGGARCRFRVYVSDGFNTTYADSETFSLPVKPPLIVPLGPEDGTIVPAGQPVHLEVEAISPRFGSLDGEAIQWQSDLQGPLGIGRELWVELDTGQHRLTVTAASGPDSVATTTLRVRVR